MLSKINAGKFNKLIEITTLINSSQQDLHVLLTHIVESAMLLCGGAASSLLLADEERKALHFEVALGSKGNEIKRFTVKMGEGIAGYASRKIINPLLSTMSRKTTAICVLCPGR